MRPPELTRMAPMHLRTPMRLCWSTSPVLAASLQGVRVCAVVRRAGWITEYRWARRLAYRRAPLLDDSTARGQGVAWPAGPAVSRYLTLLSRSS
jgi:hypothetical protein